MSQNALKSVNNLAGGERRILKQGVSGPLASSTTDALAAADTIMDQWENIGTRIHGVRADGRMIIPTLGSDPASLFDDDFWIFNNGGTPEIRYRFGGATFVVGGAGGGSPGSSGISLIPTATGTQKGGPVIADLIGPGDTKATAATAGTNSISNGLYKVIGLLAANAADLVTPIEILTPGRIVELTGPEINFLTGANELVPSAPYFLSRTTGRWTADPLDLINLGVNPVEAVLHLGRALTETSFLVDIGEAIRW